MGFLTNCKQGNTNIEQKVVKRHNIKDSFKSDVDFLSVYSKTILLENSEGNAKLVIAPDLQARVMTSTASGWSGKSYGWINRKRFVEGDTLDHINVYGGEERFWLGPEGGQFSIFFKEDTEFKLENWFTPRLIDLEPFELINQTNSVAEFIKEASLVNYSGFKFNLKISRTIKILSNIEINRVLDFQLPARVNAVGYSTENVLKNKGEVSWTKEKGLLSIWLLGMFNHTPTTVVIIPFIKGEESHLGPVVNDDYFGKVPSNRLKVVDNAILFKADGASRGKIGVSPQRAKDVLGSFDPIENTLTIIKFIKPMFDMDYVNSKWEIQQYPFEGDVINAYNDGPPEPGAEPLGPFYEMETSSPGAELKKDEELVHTQYTFHFEGDANELDQIARQTLGVSLIDIANTFK